MLKRVHRSARGTGVRARHVLPFLIALTAQVAQAQVGVLSGTITTARTNEPIAGATIAIEGTRLGSISATTGVYRVINIPPGTYTVSVRRLGYARITREITLRDSLRLDVELEKTTMTLDQVVVTGTPNAQAKRELGNAMGIVSAADISKIAPKPNVQQFLNVVPGVRVASGGGDVGSGGNTRIRGASSMTLSSEPLIYIDGVRVNNAAADAGGFPGQGGVDSRYAPSRINDINPEEIESIEVIKGPSAATLYGTEASNGVINIITKKGARGRPTVNYQVKGGANWLPDPENLFQHSYYKSAAGEIVDVNILKREREIGFPVSVYGRCPAPYKLDGDSCKGSPFRTGMPQGYDVTISGGAESLNYLFFGGWDRDEGPVEYNWKNRLSGRSNLTFTPSEKIFLDFGLGYERSRLRSAGVQQPITTAITWSCPSPGCEPGRNLPGGIDGPTRGFLAYLPEVYHDDIQGYEDVGRNTLTTTLRHIPTGWFNQRITVGGDFTDQRLSSLWKKISTIGSLYPQGRRDVQGSQASYVSADYSGTITWRPSSSLKLESAFGAQYYRKQNQSILSRAETFPVKDLETVTAGATKTAQETFVENKTVGLYVQEQLGWRDRLFLTAAVRGDDNSAFGKSYAATYYPKFSASWVVGEESFARDLPGLSSLRVRAAWGRAGQQPDAFAALRSYAPEAGQGGTPTLTPQNLGNPDLKPEVGEEFETGLDATFIDNRIGVELTYYRKTTRDALVSVPALPSLGFPGVQYRNIGSIKNDGWELDLNGDVFRSRNADLRLGLKFSQNRNEIVSLGGPASLVLNAGFGQYHVPGFPLGAIFHRRITSGEMTTVNGQPRPVNLMCESGSLTPGTTFSDGGGASVPCLTAPAVYWGSALPKWEGSGTMQLTLFRNVQLFGLVDFLGGNTILSGDIRASLLSFRNQRSILEATDPILLGYDILDTRRQPGIVKGGFAKLRQVSATYTLPSTLTRSLKVAHAAVTMSAQNFWTIWVEQRSDFGVKLVDPEIRNTNAAGADPGGLSAYNQEGWPQMRRLSFSVRVTP
ncbi:MAG: SusC/RagA family TonB-linked outer membrane protein [Gemmatimonadetes bacterium]|nr:SusC/RagA family TonB-linked outer membrane protein [Gemmatimonadota bacterium]MCC6769794.1 SusC/RagA family TonB-linked outer membrane protein [Gemmatimonadaceae bacterium]